jgi:phosphoglycolate phosphatase
LPLQAIIFDFDGTLAELTIDFDRLRDEVHQMARLRGFNGDWPGGYLLEEVEALGIELGNSFVQEAMTLIQWVEIEAARQGSLFPFTKNLLNQIRGQAYGLAIISRNCGPAIRTVFPEVDEDGLVFLPREAVAKTKPHPDHLLAACAALDVRPRESVVVGDHPMDITTALAAGCMAVGVASGRMSERDLCEAGAVLVLPDASGLLARLGDLA